jgi:hypothetical protein
MKESEPDDIEGVARPVVTDGGRSDYDLDTLDAIIEQNVWQAAHDGLDDEVADLPLRHRDGIICDGLAGHALTGSTPWGSEAVEAAFEAR